MSAAIDHDIDMLTGREFESVSPRPSTSAAKVPASASAAAATTATEAPAAVAAASSSSSHHRHHHHGSKHRKHSKPAKKHEKQEAAEFEIEHHDDEQSHLLGRLTASSRASLDKLDDDEDLAETVTDLKERIPSLRKWAAEKIEDDTQSLPIEWKQGPFTVLKFSSSEFSTCEWYVFLEEIAFQPQPERPSGPDAGAPSDEMLILDRNFLEKYVLASLAPMYAPDHRAKRRAPHSFFDTLDELVDQYNKLHTPDETAAKALRKNAQIRAAAVKKGLKLPAKSSHKDKASPVELQWHTDASNIFASMDKYLKALTRQRKAVSFALLKCFANKALTTEMFTQLLSNCFHLPFQRELVRQWELIALLTGALAPPVTVLPLILSLLYHCAGRSAGEHALGEIARTHEHSRETKERIERLSVEKGEKAADKVSKKESKTKKKQGLFEKRVKHDIKEDRNALETDEDFAESAEEASELWAAYCLERLQRLFQQGSRAQPVSVVEFDNVCERRRVFPISIFLSDGTYKQIYIDSVSTADEIADQIADDVGLVDARGYAIFEVFGQIERSLNDKDKFADELWKLEVLSEERARRAAMAEASASAAGEKGKGKGSASGSATNGAASSSDSQQEAADMGSGDMQLLFKRKLHMDPHSLSSDPVENALLFHQSSAEFLAGRLPCTQGEAVALGALLATLAHGDVEHSRKKKTKSTSTSKKADHGEHKEKDDGGETLLGAPTNYLPSVLVNNSKLTADEWKSLLRKEHAQVPCGLSHAELRTRFLELAKTLPMFGTQIFLAAHKSDWDMPVRISVGVSVEGVTLINRETNDIIYHAPLAYCQQVNFNRKAIKIHFDEPGKSRPLTLLTPEGVQIAHMIQEYSSCLRQYSTRAVAIKDYTPTEAGYLTLKRGDELEIVKRPAGADHFVCLLFGKQRGKVPCSEVKIAIPLPKDGEYVAYIIPPTPSATPRSTPRTISGILAQRFKSQQVRDFEAGRFPLYEFAREHFRLVNHSDPKNEANYDLHMRVRFSADPIAESLTKLPTPHLAREAVVNATDIMKFMGDLPIGKRARTSAFTLARTVIQRGLDNPLLRVEILCQLMKQCTGNPSSAHVIQGWKLFYLAMGCFLPSEDFTNFLLDFLHTHAKVLQAGSDAIVTMPDGQQIVRGEALLIQYLAKCSLTRIGRTLQKGNRLLAPSPAEYKRLLDGEVMMNNAGSSKSSDQPPQLLVSVEMPDTSVIEVKADSSVTGSELLLEVFRNISLPREYRQGYGLRYVCKQVSLSFPIRPQDKVADIWARADDVPLPKKQALKREELRWKLVFFKQLFDVSVYRVQGHSGVYLDLLYQQAVRSVVSGSVRVPNRELALELAALQLFVDSEGSKESFADRVSDHNIDKFLPRTVSSLMDAQSLQASLSDAHIQLKDVSVTQAKQEYLRRVHRLPLYGCEFFEINWTGPTTTKSNVRLAISGIRMAVITGHDEVLAEWRFNHVLKWRVCIGVAFVSCANSQSGVRSAFVSFFCVCSLIVVIVTIGNSSLALVHSVWLCAMLMEMKHNICFLAVEIRSLQSTSAWMNTLN